MSEGALPQPVRTYDTRTDDYCVEWELNGNVVFSLRAEDVSEPATRDGRGIRFCIGNVEVPLEWLRAEIETAKPWLTGQSD
jgi:hypothetical protein